MFSPNPRQHWGILLGLSGLFTRFNAVALAQSLNASPHPTPDIPEEILQTQVILEARSPLDGSPMTAASYAQLQEALGPPREEIPARLSPKLHRAATLLRLRKILRTILPVFLLLLHAPV
ncbi:hypothetical protein [Lyngbya confervoides]|uniref:Uncharacterized protein n=1 Tax=Lyngbya confervoides BDU141951 TaxID=1574623 RepID=A0ABD4T278_9CYAN|nr:hypothetical protein [Lyngbya confervoides]MCM1982866.1 hypothetical protein [Lyngbya confervoides BDU141951]